MLLLEDSQHIGGQLLTVTSMDGANEGGLFKDFYEALRAVYGQKSLRTCWGGQWAYEPAVGEAVLRQMLDGKVSYRTSMKVLSVQRSGNTVTGVTTQDGTRYTSRQVIDATEHGDVLPFAGAAYRVGKSAFDPTTGATPNPNDCVQYVTYTVTLQNYGPGAKVPPGFDLVAFGPPGGADYFNQLWRFAHVKADGGCNWNWADHNGYRGMPHLDGGSYEVAPICDPRMALIEKTMINALNDWPWAPDAGYPVAGIEDRSERRRADCAARVRTLQNIYQAQLPVQYGGLGERSWAPADEQGPFGYGEACPELPPAYDAVQRVFPERPYVREARRGIGVHTLTGLELRRDGPRTGAWEHSARTAFSTAVGVGIYPVDVHGCFGDNHFEADLGERADDWKCWADCGGGQRCLSACPGGPFQVPIGSLVPRDLDGLLFAEKNVSQTRLANGATRLQPITMATGQAAGALAALSVGGDARSVPPVKVQLAMLDAGMPVSLWTFLDVPRGHPRWADVQLTTTWPIFTPAPSGSSAPPAFPTFEPQRAVTRGEGAGLLQRTLRFKRVVPPSATFKDVPLDHPLSGDVEGLYAAGLTSGCAPGLYCPDASWTREQLAVMLAAGLGLSTPLCTFQMYDDVPASSGTCASIQALAMAGVTLDCGPRRFCPSVPVRRDEAAAFFARALAHMSSASSAVGHCYRTPPDYCGSR